MNKILIIEDDRGICDALVEHFAMWNMEAKGIKDFRNVMVEFTEFAPQLVLIDISLPFMNGYHWISEIRKVSNVPAIFISSAKDNMNMVMAMNMGADDFIPKPFDMNVLMSKINALLRRTYQFSDSAPLLFAKEAVLNVNDCSLTYKDEKIVLTKNEYRILLVLMQNKDKVVSRDKIMDALWQTDEFVDENTLTVNIGRLRKKLEAAGLADFIETKHGVGYIVHA